MGYAIGIELGSTRIKAALVGDGNEAAASGSFAWENRLENGFWTYSVDTVWEGLKACVADLYSDYLNKFGRELTDIKALGFSAMMHGYLAFDKDGNLLVPFRTWRNTTTEQAAAELTGLFGFNIPMRWSAAHLYQAVLNGEGHVKDIAFVTTLAGYVHWKLTGEKVLGVGDASGMFPIDSGTNTYDAGMMDKFTELLRKRGAELNLGEVFPRPLAAGEYAGKLTAEGAALLDPSGKLPAGIPLCPPEGDAGTGMVATNSVAWRTGNVSAGTSVFAMIVLEKALSKVYTEIDMVTTPTGKPVAMVHCNNCSSDIDAWARLFCEFAAAAAKPLTLPEALSIIFSKALEGDADCGGLLSYNYVSGEPVTGVEDGRPLFIRKPESALGLANFARVHIYSAIAALKIGMDILLKKEGIRIDNLFGHGGFFKAAGTGQKFMAAALGTKVSVMETAGEGGAWGMALLAAYLSDKEDDETLETYLEQKVFGGAKGTAVEPDTVTADGFTKFMEGYVKALPIEKEAAALMK